MSVIDAAAPAPEPGPKSPVRVEYLHLVAILMQPQARTDFDQGKLVLLGQSLKRQQFHPITVCPHPDIPGKYLLIDGERRVRAALLALIPGLEARVLDRMMSKQEFLEYQLAEDGLKEKLKPTEVCAAVAEWLVLTGKSQTEAGRKFGYSQGMVSRIVKLVDNIAKELQPKIDAELSMSHWLELGRLTHAPAQVEAYEQCRKLEWPRDRLKYWIDQKLGKAKPKGGPKALKGRVGKRKFEDEILPDDTHETLVEFHKEVIAKILQAHRNGIALNDIGVMFNGK